MAEPRGPRSDRRFVIFAGVVAVVAVILLALSATRAGDHRDPATGGTAVDQALRDPTRTTGPGGTPGGTGGEGTTTSTGPTTTTGPATPDQITLVFAGDLLPHSPLNARAAAYGKASGKAYDYAPMLAPMASIIGGADVAICHMETPSAPDGQKVTSYPSFGAPPELVDGAKAAGYDGCSTASNHSLDRGQAGLKRLLDQFDAQGMKHNGTARTEAEGDGAPTFYDVKGVKVANLSFSYGFNGYPIPKDAPWSVNEIDPAKIKASAARARQEGADLVVLSLHWGTEYQHDPTPYQTDLADQLLPSPDIDVIIGHHAHVVQPVGQVGGTYVVWGLGNQVSNQTQTGTRDGLTVRLHATKGPGNRWKIASVDAIPTYVDLPSFRVLPVTDALADPSTPSGLRQELRASYERTRKIIDGPNTPGVTIADAPG